ncbi:MAG: hypothetical protein K8H86_15340 [Ignavibacteriaceae bacterium]|nr:hypothetical protein [Ignavibacteriaceae bacterium]
MKRIKTRVLIGFSIVAIFFLAAVSIYTVNPKRVTLLELNSKLVKSGDIIFRKGRGFVSQMVLLADSRSPYSHSGIIIKKKSDVFVLHAVPDESEDGIDWIKLESLSNFLSSEKAESAVVYRLKDDTTCISIKAARKAEEYLKENILFDASLDLKTEDKLYCTELVWKAYKNAGIDLIDGNFDHLNAPLGSGDYIFPSSLLGSKHLTKITSTIQKE